MWYWIMWLLVAIGFAAYQIVHYLVEKQQQKAEQKPDLTIEEAKFLILLGAGSQLSAENKDGSYWSLYHSQTNPQKKLGWRVLGDAGFGTHNS